VAGRALKLELLEKVPELKEMGVLSSMK